MGTENAVFDLRSDGFSHEWSFFLSLVIGPVSQAVILITDNAESYYIVFAIATIQGTNSLNTILNQTNHFKHVLYLIIFNQACESFSCVLA